MFLNKIVLIGFFIISFGAKADSCDQMRSLIAQLDEQSSRVAKMGDSVAPSCSNQNSSLSMRNSNCNVSIGMYAQAVGLSTRLIIANRLLQEGKCDVRLVDYEIEKRSQKYQQCVQEYANMGLGFEGAISCQTSIMKEDMQKDMPSPANRQSSPQVESNNDQTETNILYTQLTESSIEYFAPSFNCTKAITNLERLICSSKELSELDLRLAKAYKIAMNATTDKNTLKSEQIYWRKNERDSCNDIQCISISYKNRIQQLEQ